MFLRQYLEIVACFVLGIACKTAFLFFMWVFWKNKPTKMVLRLGGWRVANNVIMHFPDGAASQKDAKSEMGMLLVID